MNLTRGHRSRYTAARHHDAGKLSERGELPWAQPQGELMPGWELFRHSERHKDARIRIGERGLSDQ